MKLGIIVAILVLLVSTSGCVTHRDKVAVVRGAKFAVAEGSDLGQAVASELAEVAVNIGADKIDPATVPLTAEAARENAAGLQSERESRGALLSLLGSAAGKLVGQLPWLGPVVGFGAAALEWFRRRKAQLQSAKSGEIVGVLGRAVEAVGSGASIGDVLRSEAKAMVNVSTVDVARAMEDAKAGEL